MTKKNLTWRLKSLPTATEIADLVEQKVIDKDEARELLFEKSERSKTKEYEDKIEFLEGIVKALSENRSSNITTINYPQRYDRYSWTSGGGLIGGASGIVLCASTTSTTSSI